MSRDSSFTIAVAGNPNSGKTCLFNALTGGSQTVGNYPGVTVERKEGRCVWHGRTLNLVDLPGTYSLTAYSLDEIVARETIIEENPDAVIDVVDATNLERNLYLAIQLLEMGVSVVLVLNMADLARRRGIRIDVEHLSAELGCPVVETVASRGKGIGRVLDAALDAVEKGTPCNTHTFAYGEDVEEQVNALKEVVEKDAGLNRMAAPRWIAVKMLEEDDELLRKVQQFASHSGPILELHKRARALIEEAEQEEPAAVMAAQRHTLCQRLVANAVQYTKGDIRNLTDKVDTIACHRLWGFLLVILCVYVMFKAVFLLAQGVAWMPYWDGGLVLRTPTGVFAGIFEEWLPALFRGMPDGALKSLILDGVFAGVGGVLEFVPLIFIMFFFLAIIEDSGYVTRIAFMLDRAFYAFGLQGKSIVPLIVSGGIAGGCAAPGIMATRTLREEKDRLTTMLVTPFMNCGAKMPVYAILIGAFFAAYKGEVFSFLVLLSWALALGAAFVLRKTVVKGEQTPFVMELPPYHLPHLKSVLRSSGRRCWQYVKKAGTIILGANVLIWALMYFPRLDTEKFQEKQAQLTAAWAEDHNAASDMFAGSAEDRERVLAYLSRFEKTVSAACDRGGTVRLPSEIISPPELYSVAHNLFITGAGKDSLRASRTVSAADLAEGRLKAFRELRGRLMRLESRREAEQLEHSFAGWLGRALTPVTQLAGFEWKTNIALIGGFAAKEVIVSTLGSAYSMGSAASDAAVESDGGSRLIKRIRSEWTPLRAFGLMIFVMIYAPCVVTITVLGREAGHWKWALFSTVFNTAVAFVLATMIYQIGKVVGLGG